MKKLSAGIVFAGALGLTALTGLPPALAADAHDHSMHKPTLRLDAGKKWQTDAPLREGMTKIRESVEPRLQEAHRGKLTNAQYEAIGKAVDAQLGYIVANCKLEPEADAVLHGVIAELSQGAEILTGKHVPGKRSTGVVQVVQALDSYGRYFDHPGWKPVDSGH